jgi:hypothetical protein
MSTPNNSEVVQTAIERLKPELPELLGVNYPAFLADLHMLLQSGSNDGLFRLFSHYPAANRRLEDILSQLIVAFGLYGNPKNISYNYYLCAVGPHCVASRNVMHRDYANNAFCPKHNKKMIPVESCS